MPAMLMQYWRDGFAEWISEYSGKPLGDVRSRFDDMIDCTRSGESYAAWLLPSISAVVSAASKA